MVAVRMGASSKPGYPFRSTVTLVILPIWCKQYICLRTLVNTPQNVDILGIVMPHAELYNPYFVNDLTVRKVEYVAH